MINSNSLEKIMVTYNVPKEDRNKFKEVWETLDSYGNIKTQDILICIHGSDVSAVTTIIDIFR